MVLVLQIPQFSLERLEGSFLALQQVMDGQFLKVHVPLKLAQNNCINGKQWFNSYLLVYSQYRSHQSYCTSMYMLCSNATYSYKCSRVGSGMWYGYLLRTASAVPMHSSSNSATWSRR